MARPPATGGHSPWLLRLGDPPKVEASWVIVVAAIGVVVNAVGAALFLRGREDVNVRGAFVHLAADAAVSAGVVVAGIALAVTGWRWLDPAVSLVVCGVVLWAAWSLLRDSMNLALDGVPPHVDPAEVRDDLAGRPGVRDLHDLHIWPLSANETAMTVHLVVADDVDASGLLRRIGDDMRERFGICHCTVQLEPAEQPPPAQVTKTPGPMAPAVPK